MKEKHGFTLIELLVVIIILGILAAVGIPIYTGTVEKAKVKEAYTTMAAIKESLARFAAQNATNDFISQPAIDNYNNTSGGYDVGWNTRYWNFNINRTGVGAASIIARRKATSYNVTCTVTNTNYQGTWSGDHPGYTAP